MLTEGVSRSDADALAKVNTDLISNFMEGLKLAGLTPKRFLLQTGTHREGPLRNAIANGFRRKALRLPHRTGDRAILRVGPAGHAGEQLLLPVRSIPTSSIHLTDESSRQEDKLFAYAKETGAGWNVVRPSYIIGAVRDNQLNYMFGFAVYAAVCAHLGQPLRFPGDYLAWDKEFCESSAMLNSYLSEYVSCG